jgi:two-component system OmpR family response regulator
MGVRRTHPKIMNEHEFRSAGSRRFRALVVDDERDFRHLMNMFLRRSGMPIDVAAVGSGADALSLARTEPPDLVLLDIMMPEMDGFEVCRQLRADYRTHATPILVLSALDLSAQPNGALFDVVDDYLAKPFERAEFINRVRRLLHRAYGYNDAAQTVGAAP